MNDNVKKNRNKVIILSIFYLIFVIYASVFIYRSSIEYGGTRYYCLFDDAMVSMRYAHNLADGYGPVWNIGEEAVEGYSNPLWMLMMAGIHKLPLDLSKTSLVVQIIGLIILLFNLVYVKKIADLLSDNSFSVGLTALIFTGFYLPLNFYTLMGMEVGAITLLITISTFIYLKNLKKGFYSLLPLLIIGFTVLIRIDLGTIYFIFFVFMFFNYKEQRKKTLLYGLLILSAAILSQTIFRIAMYGDFLPNTYYLKMTGYPVLLRITRGLFVTFKFIIFMNPIVFSIPIIMIFWENKKELFLLGLLILSQFAYSIYVGGDAWEFWGGSNRFVSIVMPLFLILLAFGCTKLFNIFYTHISQRIKVIEKYRHAFFLLFISGVFLQLNSLRGPVSLVELSLAQRPFTVIDNEDNIKSAMNLEQILAKDGVVAVTQAGVIPYFLDRKVIDILGKNDKYIAHLPASVNDGSSRFVDYIPGHLKWDYEYSFNKLKPDIIQSLWFKPEQADTILNKYYYEYHPVGFRYFLLKDSKNINWEMIHIKINL